MSELENPLAFPNPIHREGHGMTLRDYFAAKAMEAMIPMSQGARYQTTIDNHNYKIPEKAYEIADAMLKERLK